MASEGDGTAVHTYTSVAPEKFQAEFKSKALNLKHNTKGPIIITKVGTEKAGSKEITKIEHEATQEYSWPPLPPGGKTEYSGADEDTMKTDATELGSSNEAPAPVTADGMPSEDASAEELQAILKAKMAKLSEIKKSLEDAEVVDDDDEDEDEDEDEGTDEGTGDGTGGGEEENNEEDEDAELDREVELANAGKYKEEDVPVVEDVNENEDEDEEEEPASGDRGLHLPFMKEKQEAPPPPPDSPSAESPPPPPPADSPPPPPPAADSPPPPPPPSDSPLPPPPPPSESPLPPPPPPSESPLPPPPPPPSDSPVPPPPSDSPLPPPPPPPTDSPVPPPPQADSPVPPPPPEDDESTIPPPPPPPESPTPTESTAPPPPPPPSDPPTPPPRAAPEIAVPPPPPQPEEEPEPEEEPDYANYQIREVVRVSDPTIVREEIVRSSKRESKLEEKTEEKEAPEVRAPEERSPPTEENDGMTKFTKTFHSGVAPQSETKTMKLEDVSEEESGSPEIISSLKITPSGTAEARTYTKNISTKAVETFSHNTTNGHHIATTRVPGMEAVTEMTPNGQVKTLQQTLPPFTGTGIPDGTTTRGVLFADGKAGPYGWHEHANSSYNTTNATGTRPPSSGISGIGQPPLGSGTRVVGGDSKTGPYGWHEHAHDKGVPPPGGTTGPVGVYPPPGTSGVATRVAADSQVGPYGWHEYAQDKIGGKGYPGGEVPPGTYAPNGSGVPSATRVAGDSQVGPYGWHEYAHDCISGGGKKPDGTPVGYPTGTKCLPVGPGCCPLCGAPLHPGGYPVGPNGVPLGPGGYPMGGAPLGPGGYPVGPNGVPLGPGGYPQGPRGFPIGDSGVPLGPGGYPVGPNGTPLGPGGYPQGPRGFPIGDSGAPLGPGGYPVGPNGAPLGPGGYPQGPRGFPVGDSGAPRGPGGYPVGPNGAPLGPGWNGPNPETAANGLPGPYAMPPVPAAAKSPLGGEKGRGLPISKTPESDRPPVTKKGGLPPGDTRKEAPFSMPPKPKKPAYDTPRHHHHEEKKRDDSPNSGPDTEKNKSRSIGDDKDVPPSSIEQNKVLYANPNNVKDVPEETPEPYNPKGVTTKTYIVSPDKEGPGGATPRGIDGSTPRDANPVGGSNPSTSSAAKAHEPKTVVTTTTTKPSIFHQKTERTTEEYQPDGTILANDKEVHLMCCTIQ